VGIPFVLGGDWNTTWDISPPANNIDIINMARTPNAANGKLLQNLATQHGLIDPFRALHPNKLSFLYTPFGTQQKNRSRLDFFVLSSSLLNNVTSCDIFSSQLSQMFDHKQVFMSFKAKNFNQNGYKKKIVTNWFLDDPLVKMSSELAALQIYSSVVNENLHAERNAACGLHDRI
jgi:hypothetical protein